MPEEVALAPLPAQDIVLVGRSNSASPKARKIEDVLAEFAPPLGGAHQPLGCFDTVLLQELDRSLRRQMSALLIRGAEFQGGNQLTIAFQLRLREYARCATIRPMRGAWFGKSLECPVHGGRGDAIHLGHRSHLGGLLGTFRW